MEERIHNIVKNILLFQKICIALLLEYVSRIYLLSSAYIVIKVNNMLFM